jgi:hypothetical protein
LSNITDPAETAHADIRAFIAYANEAAVGLSVTTLKGLLLINGGAAVAMLGFVASAVGNDDTLRVDLPSVVDTLRWFATGVATSVVASGLAYIVMYLQVASVQSFELRHDAPFVRGNKTSDRLQLITNIVHVFAVFVAVASLICFLAGTLAISLIVSGAA